MKRSRPQGQYNECCYGTHFSLLIGMKYFDTDIFWLMFRDFGIMSEYIPLILYKIMNLIYFLLKKSNKIIRLLFKKTFTMVILILNNPTNYYYFFTQMHPLCLFWCKIFFGCKIFSGENIFGKGKYILVFGCILKIMLENNFQCLVIF